MLKGCVLTSVSLKSKACADIYLPYQSRSKSCDGGILHTNRFFNTNLYNNIIFFGIKKYSYIASNLKKTKGLHMFTCFPENVYKASLSEKTIRANHRRGRDFHTNGRSHSWVGGAYVPRGNIWGTRTTIRCVCHPQLIPLGLYHTRDVVNSVNSQ